MDSNHFVAARNINNFSAFVSSCPRGEALWDEYIAGEVSISFDSCDVDLKRSIKKNPLQLKLRTL